MQSLTPTDRLIFIHIPKTAGLTFRAILANHFDYNQIYPQPDDWYYLYEDARANLANYRLFSGHFPYSVCELLPSTPPPLYVTMLRDPVERFISNFHFTQANAGASFHLLAQDMTLA